MRKAFTLVELLVAITVIAILAAILFPVFARTRERARLIKCINNLHQIGIAFGPYLQDWDDRYPWAYRKQDIGDEKHPVLMETLSSYVRENRIWICPSDTGETFMVDPTTYHRHTPPFYTYDGSSYDYIGLQSPIPILYYGLAGYPAVKLRKPALFALCFEDRPWHGNYRADDKLIKSPGRINVLCADGHVTRKPISRLTEDNNLAISSRY